jgi:hypothetical protein
MSDNEKQNILAKPLEITPAMFDGKGVLELVDKLDGDLRAIVLDGKTKKGREECISLAANVRKSKAHIDKVGADLVKPLKDKAKVVDLQRRQVKEKLDTLATYLRQPATDWEFAEQKRIDEHRQQLQAILKLKDNIGIMDVEPLKKRLVDLNEFRKRDFEEYSNDATLYIDGVQGAVDTAIKEAEKRAADAAELERLRKEKAEREALERKQQEEKRMKEEGVTKADIAETMPEFPERQAVHEYKEPETTTPPPAQTPAPSGREHTREVHNQIADALVSKCGLDEETAKKVVVAVVRKQIPFISIQY